MRSRKDPQQGDSRAEASMSAEMRCADTTGPEAAGTSAGEHEVAFAVKLARALHEYGTPTHRLEEIMDLVTRRLGLEGQVFSLPTGIFLSFGAPEEQRSTLIRVEPSRVDLGKLALISELTGKVIRGDLDAVSGTIELDRIIAAPGGYPAIATVLCYGMASGAASALFGGGWRESVVSASIGVTLGLLSLILGRWEDASRLSVPLSAIVASAL